MLSDTLRELADLRREDGISAEHSLDRTDIVFGFPRDTGNEAIDQPPGEPHSHSNSGAYLVGERRWNGVVKDSVQVRDWDVHAHLRDRVHLG
jgi:hypothetical protein